MADPTCPICKGRAIFTTRPSGGDEWDEYHFMAKCSDVFHPWNRGAAPPPDPAADPGPDGAAPFDARLYGKTRFVPVPVAASTPADDDEDDVRRCEGCAAPATTSDVDDVPLCRECAQACVENANAAAGGTLVERLQAALREHAVHPHPMSWHGELMTCDLCGSEWNNGKKRSDPATPETHKPGCLLVAPPAPADDASGAEAMREAARALFDLGCANGGDPGVVSYDSAEIHASLDRIFDKAWRDSPLRALPLPAAPAPDAVGEARDRFTEAALHAIGCRAAYGPNHPAAMNPSAKVREAWAALLAAERAQGEKGGDRG